MAENPSEVNKLSHESLSQCSKRICELQDEQLKLQKAIFIKSLTFGKQDMRALMKTNVVKCNRSLSCISMLKINNRVVVQRELAGEINHHLEETFKQVNGDDMTVSGTITDGFLLSEEEIAEFSMVNFSYKNILDTMKQTNVYAPAGPDAIPLWVFIKFSYLFVPLFMKLFPLWISGGEMNEMRTEVYITVFNKLKLRSNALNGGDFTVLPTLRDIRPIAVQNVDSKIFARILNKCLVAEIEKKIFQNQFCLKGRSINIAILLAKQAHEYAKKVKCKDWIFLLLDMKAAFDSVNLEFLMGQLVSMGVSRPLVNGIRNYIFNKSAALKFNGCLGKGFRITRGLGQGSPLSSTLYAVCCNSLLCDLYENLGGIELPWLVQPLSVISYADDIALVLRSKEELAVVLRTIESYHHLSGLSLNPLKSSMYRMVDMKRMDVEDFGLKSKFLGLPHPFFGRVARWRVQNQLCEKIGAIIDGVKYVKLSFAAKIEIFNKLCVPKLAYLAKFFSFTKKFFERIDSMFTKFMWKNKLVLISRRVMFGSPKVGGLNLLNPRIFVDILKANLLVAWCSYMSNFNIIFPVTPQDTPPPGVCPPDLVKIIAVRQDLCDDIPRAEVPLKLSMAIVRTFVIDVGVRVDWASGPCFMKKVKCLELQSYIVDFAYKLSHKRIAVKSLLIEKYGLQLQDGCVFGCSAQEDIDHLLLNCMHIRSIWLWIQELLQKDILAFHSIFEVFENFINESRLRILIMISFLWWKMRCLWIFDGMKMRPQLYIGQEMERLMNLDRNRMDKGSFGLFWPKVLVEDLSKRGSPSGVILG